MRIDLFGRIFRRRGLIKWNPEQAVRDTRKKGGKNFVSLPAQVLDFLLSKQELIPPEWRGEPVLFMDTVYTDDVGLWVRALDGLKLQETTFLLALRPGLAYP